MFILHNILSPLQKEFNLSLNGHRPKSSGFADRPIRC